MKRSEFSEGQAIAIPRELEASAFSWSEASAITSSTGADCGGGFIGRVVRPGSRQPGPKNAPAPFDCVIYEKCSKVGCIQR